MEKLGLFGGTFAPPHLGHVRAARMMLEEIQPDRLLIMPTAIPPHKVKVKGDTPELRLEMCRAAFGELPGTEVRFTAIPRNCFGTCGKPLVSDWLKV